VTSLPDFTELPIDEQKARGLQFTPREIAQQPRTWKKTVEIFEKHQESICGFLEQAGLQNELEQRPVVMLIGAGTSDYIGGALELLLRQKWGCEVSACASTDLLPSLEDYIVAGRKYLWISFSRSGDSPEAVASIEKAIELHDSYISHLVVTCNAKARMLAVCEKARHACAVVLDDAVNDRSLAMTSSFTNMIVMGHCLAHAWSFEEYSQIIEELIVAAESFLGVAEEEARRISSLGFSRICMVGAGSLSSVARESALKVLEMTNGQVNTMSQTVLGLRHGPMAALDTHTLFVCFVSGESRRASYARDLLREVGEKGIVAERIAVGTRSCASEIMPFCESYLSVGVDVDDRYRPILDVIFGQLLGLYCSVARDLKPDSPSPGGVISRVVQEFRIY
jgi:tagatose-6-phosphate ketose/aldose isomerase